MNRETRHCPECLRIQGELDAAVKDRDEAVRSAALYREMFEANNRQRDELILENFKLKSAQAEDASRMPGAKP